MTSSELQDLLVRVEAATGPDRELDALIALTVDGFFVDGDDPWGRPKYCYMDAIGQVSPGQGHDMLVRRYTSSLDAAHALAMRSGFYIRTEPRFHLDGERVDFISHALRPRWNDWRPDDEWFDRGEGRHANQVLSALAALLTAKIAETARPATAPSKAPEEPVPSKPQPPITKEGR